jgi:hypothetical protein
MIEIFVSDSGIDLLIWYRKESLLAFQTPVKLRDDGDDDLVFMGTPTEKELELAAKLNEMPTIKAKGEREKEARVSDVDSRTDMKSPTIARIVKKSLLASPKRTLDRSTIVLDKLKTPPPVAVTASLILSYIQINIMVLYRM